MKAPIPEFKSMDITPGITCEHCGLSYVNAEALERVRLADAELLFCMQCGVAIAVIQNGEMVDARKIA